MKESDVQDQIQLELSAQRVVTFRNNTGMAWQGTMDRRESVPGRKLVLWKPRAIHAGLCKGSSDLIGWKSVVITKEMVGRTVAVMTVCEVKRPGESVKAGGHQDNFLEQVAAAGGIAIEAHSSREAAEGVAEWMNRKS